jgi:putative DNA primase/helicase
MSDATPWDDEDIEDIRDARERPQREPGRKSMRAPNGHAGQAAINSAIIVKPGERHIAADEGIQALVQANVPFYQRDRSLVRVCRIKAKSTTGEIIFVPGIVPVSTAILARELGRSAPWEKVNRRGTPIRIDPPKEVVEQILGMTGEWPFNVLSGVIGCPTLRPDGSLLTSEGYDATTGLVLYNSIAIPPISEFPTADDAKRAVSFISGLLTEFPFASHESNAVALSQLITPVLRGAMAVAPMHLSTAPQPGTGKSYLADLASMIATGEPCAVISVAPNAEETEKRLIGAALAGYPIIALDNCRELLQGDFLCQVTERPLLQLRRLGSSDQIRVANTFTVLGNGNNATVADDMVRRTITCAIDANMENPETRSFKANPLKMIRGNRGAYIAAALTIARAYIAAGQPGRLPPIESYEQWSNIVRSPLVWLGYGDPLDTMEAARGLDPVREARGAVFLAWREALGIERAFLSAEIVDFANARYDYNQSLVCPSLHAALLEVAAQRSAATQIDTRRLGRWLQKHTNTIACGFKLTVDHSDKSRPRWQLLPCS